MGNKRFKDPIYGYVEIDEKLITQVVDSACFQRLRDIIQTSYSPLYASAVHNRFVHSLGVYHLGRIAAEAFQKVDESDRISNIEQYIDIFKLACLLHDIGHAPFSHTGEQHYLLDGKRDSLHAALVRLTGDSDLEKEITSQGYKAAPHELMSAIVAIETFPELISEEMNSFFARCITGYKYALDMNEQKSLLNCLIELLNSTIIDVDKLDYLIRDSYMTGFDTVKIDYVRFLNSIRIIKNEKNEYCIGYYKTAVSVIENVVYAHDAERKWIQNHPAVLYEAHLLDSILDEVIKTLLPEDCLTEEYLSEEGVNVDGVGRIRLLGDSDIFFLMKNLEKDDWVREYYGRGLRKHPIWKSEAEFQAIFLNQETLLARVEEELHNLTTHLRSLGVSFLINQAALDACKKDLYEDEKQMEMESDEELKRQLKISIGDKSYHVKFMELWEAFAKEEKVNFEFLIIHANQFNSSFRKPEFGSIPIVLPELWVPCRLDDISNVLRAQKSKGEQFFYVYYSRNVSEKPLSIANFRRKILKFAGEFQEYVTERQVENDNKKFR